LVLPVLGALPDSIVILASGLGPIAQAQQQLNVGIGTLAGSTIMLLTVPWVGCVFLGRCDIDEGKAKDKTLTRKWSFLTTGVEVESYIPVQARIMLATAVTYLIIQIAAFVFINNATALQRTEDKDPAIAAFVFSILCFICYCCYMILHPKFQEYRIAAARKKLLIEKVIYSFNQIQQQKALLVPAEIPLEASGESSSPQTPRLSDAKVASMGIKWKLKAREAAIEKKAADLAAQDASSGSESEGGEEGEKKEEKKKEEKKKEEKKKEEKKKEGEENDAEKDVEKGESDGKKRKEKTEDDVVGLPELDEDDDDVSSPAEIVVNEKESKWKIGRKAGLILLVGTAFVACFSDPIVDTITRGVNEVGISNY